MEFRRTLSTNKTDFRPRFFKNTVIGKLSNQQPVCCICDTVIKEITKVLLSNRSRKGLFVNDSRVCQKFSFKKVKLTVSYQF